MIYIRKGAHEYCFMFLKTLEKRAQKFMNQIRQKFISDSGLAWQIALENTKIKLDLLTDIDILLVVQTGIKSRLCNSVNKYQKDNNK